MTQLTGPDPTAAEVTARRRRAIFIVTALGAFMASLDLSIVNVAFPALERAFSHDTRASLSWVITGYSIVFGSLLVVAGRTADRLGSRRVFFFGLGLFCVGSLLCGVAPSVATLIMGRVVQGVGAAAVLPSSLGLLLGAYPKEKRSQIVSLWGGIGALAVATGPSLGAVLITAFSWRAAFYVNLPVGLIAWLVGRRVLAKTPGTGTSTSPDFPGVILLSAALALLVLAISEGPSWGWSNGRIIGGFVVAVLLFTGFLFRSLHHEEPVLDLTLFRARTFSVANTTMLLYAMGFFAMLLGNILFLTSVWHYSILDAGLSVTPGPLVVALVSGSAGKLAVRVGFRNVIMSGLGIFTLGIGWYLWRVTTTLTFPVVSAAAVSSLEAARYSVGSAVNQTARQVGGALGVAILVVILGTPRNATQALHNFDHLWWYIASTTVLAGLVASRLGRPRPAMTLPPRDEFVADASRGTEEMLDGEIALDVLDTTSSIDPRPSA